MRTAPPSDFVLTRFGLWRGGVAALCAAAFAAVAAWVWAVPHDAAVLAAGVVAGGAIAGALAGVARRPHRVNLRWAAAEWFVAVGATADVAGPYQLDVPIDLGVWMLLRLRAEGLRTVWVPAQRRGQEAQWHAVRRAVYSPRPTVGGPPGAEPHPPE